ncbi:MAG: cytochrome c3 family protein [Acidobacteria bacterium]|nr:cytochrome c3 family protein [Acidobacteriota bacterium]
MAQIFHRSTNVIAKVSILGAVFILAAVTWVLGALNRSPYVTQVNVVREQPVPFSHKHHVSQLGIDCRYCHTSVEVSSFGGIPPTEACMTCHSQIHTNSPILEPVRKSWRTNNPIPWTRVYDLPDFVYFDHSIHVNKGIGCSTCHGAVDQMPLMWSESPLQMEWCLQCHREPERFVRPRDQVFNMGWSPPADQLAQGQRLVKEYKIQRLTDCYTCHR